MAEYIGTIDGHGEPVWPDKTISGQPVTLPVAAMLNVPGGFVVLDRTPPPEGFDVQAALDALNAPAPTAPKGKKGTHESEGAQ